MGPSHANEAPALMKEEISFWISAVNKICPFFSSLAMFAEHEITETIPTAATDGKRLLFNPTFMGNLPLKQRLGVFVHELLHAALLHPSRIKARCPTLWNIAADIVVNEIVLEQNGLALPAGALRNWELAHLNVEEVYAVLLREQSEVEARIQLADSGIGWDLSVCPIASDPTGDAERNDLATSEIGTYWKSALLQAETTARMTAGGRGSLPAAMQRAFDWGTRPTLDWKTMLWRHLVRTPVDFSGFDRRFVGDGLYLENLEGETLRVAICVDTSGSISRDQLSSFLTEVIAILRAYQHITATLFFADAALYGPIAIDASSNPETELKPEGGGGTSFRPFFSWLEKNQKKSNVAVYLTDGFGTFPPEPPRDDVLWVVPPGGLSTESFPFGEVSRIIK